MRSGRTYRRCRTCTKSFRSIPGSRKTRCPEHPSDPGTWTFTIDTQPPGEPRKRLLRSGFASETEAKAALAAVRDELSQRGSYRAPSSEPLGSYVETWFEAQAKVVRPTTHKAERPIVARHIVNRPIGSVPMHSVQPRHVQELADQLDDEGLSPKSILNVLSIVNRAMRHAVEMRDLTENPVPPVAARVRKMRSQADPPELTVWEPSEVAAFLARCRDSQPPALHPLMTVLATTGARRSEALALTVNDLDFESGLVTIDKTLVGVDDDGQPVLGRPKTKRSVRQVALPAPVLDLIREHIMRRPVTPTHGLLFTWEDGSPLKPDWASRTFRRIADRLAAEGQVRPGARLHDLRHAWASTAEDIGVPRKIVTDQVGHGSEAFTGSTYVHAREGAKQRAADAVAAAYGLG